MHPVDGTGHLNALLGLGQVLSKRGHTLYFLINSVFSGAALKYGFQEILLYENEASKHEDPQQQKDRIKTISEHLNSLGIYSGKYSSAEKLKIRVEKVVLPEILPRAIVFNNQIGEAIKSVQPDVIVLDHAFITPAIRTSGIPYVMCYSMGPRVLYKSGLLPPLFSGTI